MMTIKDLNNDIKICTKCDLYREIKNYVIGDGNIKSKVMFIGEAPGKTEDARGKPFVGKAGKVFEELLRSIELFRTDVYISNCLRCRPPNNREPSEAELFACTPYLDKEIEIIKPKVLCPMGNFAVNFVFKKYGIEKQKGGGISRLHGSFYKVKNLFDELTVLPLYHPAMAVYNPLMKKILMDDFKKIEKIIK